MLITVVVGARSKTNKNTSRLKRRWKQPKESFAEQKGGGK
jgi:hypothetical protein